MNEEIQAVTVKLEMPFTYEDKTFEEITMDFGRLTGMDAIAIEEELEAVQHTVTYPLGDGAYIRMVAARASGIAEDVFIAMPIRNYVAILHAVRMFLVTSKTQMDITQELEKMTGADYQAIEEELEAEHRRVFLPSQDNHFLRKLAARASGVEEQKIKAMPIGDYMDLMKKVQDFLKK